MSFIWPYMLFTLAIVPALAALYLLLLRRRRSQAIRFGNLGVIQAAAARSSSFRRHLPPLLLLAGIAFLLVATARPATEVVLPSQRGTVILAMDISGSMRATDIVPSRLEASRVAARAFVEEQPRNVRIGIVAFAGSSIVAQAPTLDRGDVLAAIERFQTQMGTAVGSGILTSLAAIFEDFQLDVDVPEIPGGRAFGFGGGMRSIAPVPPAPEGARLSNPVPPGSYESAVVVLLTDGQTTQGPDPIVAAQVAADLGVRIYTVGLGTEEGAILSFFGRSMRVQLDETALQTIADRTHAQYFRADSDTALQEIYRALSTQLVLEREETEVSALFAALGALLVVAAAILSMLWYSRIA